MGPFDLGEEELREINNNESEVDVAPSEIPTLPTSSKVERWQKVPPGMTQYQIELNFFPRFDP